MNREELNLLIEYVLKSADVLETERENMIDKVKEVRKWNENSEEVMLEKSFLRVLEEAERNIRVSFKKVEEQMLDFPPRTPVETKDYLEKTIGMKLLSVEDDEIIITMPMLPKRLSKSIAYVGRQSFVTDSTQNYKKELQYLLRSDEKIWEILPRWWEKTIHFFFVYGKEMKRIIDTDGHETKPVIDALTSMIRTGDTGPTTKIVMETVINKTLNTQTIIVLSRNIVEKPRKNISEIMRGIYET